MNQSIIIGTLAALLSGAASLQAQNPVGDFTIERILALSGVISPYTPSLPDPVLAGIQNGVLEIHQRFIYSSAERTMEQFAFVVPANSPLPFPDLHSATIADHYLVQIESTGISSLPSPSVILSGHATSNDPPTPFGNITGAGVTLAFGYRGAGASVQYGPIMESVSPLYNLYSPTGAGSLSLNPTTQKCSMATLNGTYMFRLGGSLQDGLTFGPYWESGTFTADGNGSMTIMDSGNFQGAPFSSRIFPGNYTVDANCRGTITFSGGAMDVQVSRDGKRINMVFTKPSTFIANGSGEIQ
jgi:hypothetical protein